MSLLETKNKKFNIPFVFIAGALFLIVLAYFANYVEGLSQEGINLELPRAVENEIDEESISIRIIKSKEIYIDSSLVKVTELEEKLKILFDGYASPTILLHMGENVPISEAVTIMEIANKNQYKIILDVLPK